MTTEQLEKRYDLHLGQLILDWDLTNFYSERASYFTLHDEFWEKVSEDPELTFGFIELYKDYLRWSKIDYSKWGNNLEFARTFFDKINWNKYGDYFIVCNNESVIREFKNYLDFRNRIRWGIRSLDFKREFSDEVKWKRLGYWYI